jgi:outer membrane receptor protein involved in Fe transport
VYANQISGSSEAANPALNLSFRDFLIGAPYSSTEISDYPTFYLRSANYSTFLQDDYRVARRLTLNLGVRYDHYGNPTEKYNHFSNFDPSVLSATAIANGGAGLQEGFVIPGRTVRPIPQSSRRTTAIFRRASASPMTYSVTGNWLFAEAMDSTSSRLMTCSHR